MDTQLVVPPVWDTIFSCLFEPPETSQDKLLTQFSDIRQLDVLQSRIAIFGGAKVGKSTFAKWLVNKLWIHTNISTASFSEGNNEGEDPFVLYIDLDPGQTEFTPPGVISVVKITEPIDGPNYSHLRNPLLSKYIGCVNVSDCPGTYLKCVKEIFDTLNNDETYKNMPWVVNTMGFCRGLGVALACKIICIINPNLIFQFTLDANASDESKRTYPWFLKSLPVKNYVQNMTSPHWNETPVDPQLLEEYQFITLDSVFSEILEPIKRQIWTFSSKELRDNMILSYFSQLSRETDDNNLLAVVPRVVSLASITVATMSTYLPYEDILRSMVGNLVALCHLDSQSQESVVTATAATAKPKSRLNKKQNQKQNEPNYQLHPSPSIGNKYLGKACRFSNNFYGYGIVRSIDMLSNVLYIITPVPQDILVNGVNSIVTAGAVGLPTQLYLHALSRPEDRERDGEEPVDLPYVMSKNRSKSKLNQAPKKKFVPNRVAHTVLKNCLM